MIALASKKPGRPRVYPIDPEDVDVFYPGTRLIRLPLFKVQELLDDPSIETFDQVHARLDELKRAIAARGYVVPSSSSAFFPDLGRWEHGDRGGRFAGSISPRSKRKDPLRTRAPNGAGGCRIDQAARDRGLVVPMRVQESQRIGGIVGEKALAAREAEAEAAELAAPPPVPAPPSPPARPLRVGDRVRITNPGPHLGLAGVIRQIAPNGEEARLQLDTGGRLWKFVTNLEVTGSI